MKSLYDPIAAWYDAGLRSGSPVHAVAIPALLKLAGDSEGLEIVDLACGNGIVARELAARGARITGIDLCEPLLDIARAEEERDPAGIRYLAGDIRHMSAIADARFDAAICSLALMDIDELDRCLSECCRVVRPGGWFAFTITHPCYQGPETRWTGKAGGTVKREVRGYFREGHWRSDNPHGVRGQVGAYHRTLSTYVNALVASGWIIEAMLEPQPDEAVALRVPGYSEVPVVLAVRCRRAETW